LVSFGSFGCLQLDCIAIYRDKKVVSVFVRFSLERFVGNFTDATTTGRSI
jgi:hypothetical protein